MHSRQARKARGSISLFRLGPIAALALLAALDAAAARDIDNDMDMAGFDEPDVSVTVRDPVEPVNRALYHVNDKLYFWLVKPLATGYSRITAEPVREGIDNMFSNIGMPRRALNCLLQAKFADTGTELSRFALNSSLGVLGFFDVATSRWGLDAKNEDFGQTLGRYGVGYGIFLTLPVFGPSSPRDTLGLVADSFLDPLNYVIVETPARIAVKATQRVNYTSLHLGRYEKSKDVAIDHYISLRESYIQYRKKQIRD